ncbi:hypothetical protein ACH4VR_35815 [Streptomyces sp. NPDC020883]|uniref:hypothetical protein n=1 Tax=Streptomyces sp. NPDC020883 TaxID=3365099 RepID=UPI00379441E2
MPFRPRTAATGAVLAAAVVLPAPAAAAAAPGWSAAPTGTARTSFYLEGPPGTALTDRLDVRNPSLRPVTVRLAGDGGDGSGAWLAFGSPEVTVPPRTRAGVPFTVAVPRTAVPGSHLGTLTVTGTGPGAPTRIPVRLRVTGPTLSALTVEQVSVTRRGSAVVIHYTLVNRGNTALRPRLAVRADGLFGALLRRPAHTLPDVLPPGARVDRTETWPDPPALDPVDIRLTATAAGGAHDTATASYAAVPWAAGAAALLTLLAAGGGCWVLVRRRRRTGGAGRTDGAPGSAVPGPRQEAPMPGRRTAEPGTPESGATDPGMPDDTTTGSTAVTRTGSGVHG